MKKALLSIVVALSSCLACRAEDSGRLANRAVTWRWTITGGKLDSSLESRDGGTSVALTGECFELLLGDGKKLKASDFKLVKPPRTEDMPVSPDAPTASHHEKGRQLVLELRDDQDSLDAVWKAELRDGSGYVRETLTLRASEKNVLIKELILFDQKLPEARVEGTVDGSPVVAGTFFCGLEHPMAQNVVDGEIRARCLLTRNAVLKAGEDLTESLVLGLAQPGHLRRSFLAYVERERTHPYRPFLHYNSWFDIAWDKQKFNEIQSLAVIEQFGRELVTARAVQMDSFLFDDGWDDDQTLWRFHPGFPDGFTNLKQAAARYHSGIGVWVSPFGGYDEARARRLDFGSKRGYETNSSGFSLAGPKYYHLFRGICLEMIQKYGVNQFKFDGLAAGAKASQNGLTRDGDAMLQLVSDLRQADPNIYINQTTGTWPSPFWLLNVDSTWRGGDDHNFQGQGSWCQQWMNYRDAKTFENIVNKAPLYPLNSLMLHGIIYATNAMHLSNMSDADFAAQVRTFFASGTQLQELYITPALLDRQNWDDLAEAANWSRQNADVLVDTHWIGGNPARREVYGWAAWSPRKGIFTLRNPGDKPAAFAADLKTLFELPPGSAADFRLNNPWKNTGATPLLELSAEQSHTFNLRPFEILILEAKPVSAGDHQGPNLSGAAAAMKTSPLQ